MRNAVPDGSKVALAQVTKAVGLKGGVKIRLLCDSAERLREIRQAYRGPGPDSALPVTIGDVSVRANGVVLFFEDCQTRETAEGLKGSYVFVDETESIPAGDDRPRVHELVGCEVRTRGGKILGQVRSVYDLPSSRLVGVEVGDGREVLVPYVEAWVVELDRGRRRLILVSDELFEEQ